ncbi:non-ribosomal peptide synthetase [Rhodococcus sp. A5(2022)]|uniref:non-ribosomal peptide synthetase n=1 Tax=Rhodococcus sp. A5(2022) TaxID=3003588 RepID=UPI0022A81A0A|nr:non-ribosomal peptide synthetase [Rhodococcus sp. A5(2022)]MCZ1070320.1 amino acid adenylation domain-containing protein [Rhodococcus sp. A5(2022)]
MTRTSALEDIVPLSPLQQGLLYLSTVAAPDDAARAAGAVEPDAYTVQSVLRLTGRVDEDTLRASAQALLDRHPALRTCFRPRKDGRTAGLVVRGVEALWRSVDLTGFAVDESERRLADLLDEDLRDWFDLARPPLIRWLFVRFGPDDVRLVLTAHHIVVDGWSTPILVRELLEIYAAGGTAAGLAPVRPFRDYLSWLDRQDHDAARALWRESLDGLTEPSLVAPPGATRATTPTVALAVDVPVELNDRLTGLARDAGVTLNTVLQTGWALLLSGLLGRDDIVFGATVSGRPPELTGVESMVGLFINTVPVRVRLDPRATVTELLRQVQLAQSRTVDHQYLGLAEVQRETGLGELFDTLTVFESYPVDRDALDRAERAGGVTIAAVEGRDATNYPLVLTAGVAETLVMTLDYRPGVFTADDAAALADRLVHILDTLAAAPDRPAAGLDLLTGAERGRVLGTWSVAPAAPADGTVAALPAPGEPGTLAVVCGAEERTFAELGANSARLARLLIELGVGPDVLVGLALPRSAATVEAILAVLAAGGAYLPLDPSYPADRLAHMVADARPGVVLTTGAVAAELGATLPGGGAHVVVLDDPDVQARLTALPAAAVTDADRRRPLRPGHTAYVVYTSGSTGLPKGVVVTHANLADFLAAQRETIMPSASGTRRVLLTYPFAFDSAVAALTWLLSGHTLHVLPDEHRSDTAFVVDYVRTHRIDHVDCVPVLMSGLLDAGLLDGDRHRPATVTVGGEAVGSALWQRLRAADDVEAYNCYGPTECTVDAAYTRIGGDTVTIGGPTPGTRLYVLDRWLRPAPPGVAGELYVAGGGLARGYLGQPGRTGERFVADPFTGDRMYRTGDIVRWLPDPVGTVRWLPDPIDTVRWLPDPVDTVRWSPDPVATARGALEYVGRADDQVKIRGFRVELGEVEAALGAVPGVDAAVVVAHTDARAVRRLVGYVTGTADPGVVRASVAARLPDYLVPAVILPLPVLPTTANGKVDRKALPEPDFGALAGSGEPRTDTEAALCSAFAEVLGLDRVGIDDDFFTLGGDSIVSIQLVSRARAADVRITARQVFELRTVAALAAACDADTGDEQPARPVVAATGPVPLTPIVRETLDHGGDLRHFAQSRLLVAPAGLTEAHLAAAVAALLRTHPMLRSRLTVAGDNAEWIVPEDVPDPESVVRRVDAAGLDGPRWRALFETERARALAELDPAAGRMIRVLFLDAGPGAAGRVFVVVHHLVVDGVSWRILVPDLAAAVDQARRGTAPDLEPAGTSFRDWALGLTAAAASDRIAQSLPRWQQIAGTAEPRLGARPLDPARDTVATTRSREVRVPVAVAEKVLTTVPAAYRAGVADVLLTALALAVTSVRGGDGLRVHLEGHGRAEHVVPGADLSRTVGWFTTLYPAVLDVSGIDPHEALAGTAATGTALAQVKESLRALPDDGIGFGLLRRLAPEGTRNFPGYRSPDVMFNYLGRMTLGENTGQEWSTAPEAGALGGAVDPGTPLDHVLDINAVTEDGPAGPEIVCEFTAAEVLDEETLTLVSRRWVEALTALARHADAPGAGGPTPSDLTYPRLTITELDSLTAELGPIDDVVPLTPLQRGMFFLAGLDGGTGTDVYSMQTVLDLRGDLDRDTLRRSAAALLHRHANLRTGFRTTAAGDPIGVVLRDPGLRWTDVALTPTPVTTPAPVAECHIASVGSTQCDIRPVEERSDELVAADRATRFDVAAAPLVRFTLVCLAPDRHRLIVAAHHLLLDGWSSPLLVQELFTLYGAGADPAALPAVRPFTDYLAWLGDRDTDDGLRRWSEALTGVEEPTLLAPAGSSLDATLPAELPVPVPAGLAARLQRRCRDLGVTVNTAVQTAWAVLLGARLDRTDVTFGAVVSGRVPDVPGIETMIGLFINTVPVRVALRPGEPTDDLLRRVQGEQNRLLDHQYVGLADIQRAVGVGELFDTLIVFESYPIDTDALARAQRSGGLDVTDVRGHDATNFPLVLVAGLDDELALTLEYQRALFTAGDADEIGRRLVHLLEQFAGDRPRRVAQLDVLGPAERGRWHELSSTAPAPSSGHGTVPALLAAQVARTPDATAVVCGDEHLTFAELGAASARLARRLIDEGVGPEALVGLALPRSAEMMVAICAVHAAGGAYVPMDPSYPAERLAHMAGDSRPRVVVTGGGVAHTLRPVLGAVPVLDLDDESVRADVAVRPAVPVTDRERTAPLRPEHPVYVIYTSGSTGLPKGVAVTHANLLGLFDSHRADLYVPTVAAAGRPSVGVGHAWSFGFDASWQPMLWLLDGHAVHVFDEDTMRDPEAMVGYVAAHALDFLEVTPSFLDRMVAAGLFDGEHRPATVGFGGEAVNPALWRRLRELTDGRAFNLYGPTECTVDSLVGQVTDADAPCLGRAVHGAAAYVLDRMLRPVPVGVAGELYVAGSGVARGYLGRPDLTGTRFLPDPFGPPGARMYRTGDVVRRVPAGDGRVTLEFLGRGDDQVKIRGFRVELGEVEAALTAVRGVRDAVAVAHTDDRGVCRLVGYVVPDGDVDPAVVRAVLAERVPDYLVPAAVLVLAAFPVTANGKVDRKALPEPDFGALAGSGEPRTAREAALAEVAAEVLGLDRVGIDDDFFALGGDSIVSIQFVSRARAAGIRLTARQVFELRTVAALAAVDESDTAPAAVPAVAATGDVPITPIVWEALAWGGDLARFSQARLLVAPVGLTVDVLGTAVAALLDTHPMLRSRFVVTDGGPRWTVPEDAPDIETLVRRVEVGEVDAERWADRFAAEREIAYGALDPESGVMVQVIWFDFGPDRPGRVFVAVHHLVIDGVSWRILVPDLADAVEQAGRGETVALTPPGTSFRAWATGLAEAARSERVRISLPAWQPAVEPPLGARPLDPVRDTVAALRSTHVRVPVPVTEDVLASGAVNDALLAALAVAVASVRGGDVVRVELEGHGREEQIVPGSDVARTVGWFTSMFPVALNLSGIDPGDALAEAAAAHAVRTRVTEALKAVPDNGIGFGLLHRLAPDPAFDRYRRPQVVFNYLGRMTLGEDTGAPWSGAPEAVALGGSVDPATPLDHVLHVDAVVEDTAEGPVLDCEFAAPAEVLDEHTVDLVARRWVQALAAAARIPEPVAPEKE